jgi:dihydrofolate reductase
MRKVIASMLMTVDGFFEGPDREFVPPPWNEEMTRYSDDITEEADTILYGRVSFEMNKGFWQAAETDPSSPAAQLPFAHKMNSLRKVVFSRTLADDPGWNARVVRGDIASEVAALKREPGKAMVMFGGAVIMNEFMKLGLIDEYRFLVNPMMLGAGAPLFRGGYQRFPLELLRARAHDNGVVMLYYQTVRGT